MEGKQVRLSSRFPEEADEGAYLLSLLQASTPSSWRALVRPATLEPVATPAPTSFCQQPRIGGGGGGRVTRAKKPAGSLPTFQPSPPRAASRRAWSIILQDSLREDTKKRKRQGEELRAEIGSSVRQEGGSEGSSRSAATRATTPSLFESSPALA